LTYKSTLQYTKYTVNVLHLKKYSVKTMMVFKIHSLYLIKKGIYAVSYHSVGVLLYKENTYSTMLGWVVFLC